MNNFIVELIAMIASAFIIIFIFIFAGYALMWAIYSVSDILEKYFMGIND